MDWLTFKICVLIWVLCVSKSQSQLQNCTSSLSNRLRSACEYGQPIVPPDQCNSCICFAGKIYCTNIPCPEQDCVNGVDLPQPDECNKCICRRGKVTCSNMICIPAPYCAEKQLYPAQNKCNACMCLKGFITCTNNLCAEEQLPSTIPTTTTKIPKKKKKCIEGESLPGSDECIECFCQNGGKRCKYICNLTLESRFGQEPECVSGQHIPRPDDCNNCICFERKIHCTHLPCRMDTRIGPECSDDQPVFRPDECNECYCFEGRLECSNLVCIRGSKCVQDQVIPKPDSCNACKCVEGHILCTNYQCPIPNSRNVLIPGISSTEVRALDECQEGDIISPPLPPNDCNTCYCMDNRILCTMNTCEGSDPEMKGRLREPNEQTDLEIFDKQISVEPFIHMLSKNYEKIPAKLIHTHVYNGFHQEIKVHANHLTKDATKLLKVLATSLDNAALTSISQRLLASSNSLSNNHDSKIPLDHQVVKTNTLGEGNVLTIQSSKLITLGSQSNETILVLSNTEPLDGQNSQSVLPLASKHETIWKSVSSPGSLVFNKNPEINPRSGQEEKLNVYYYDNPPSMFTPINKNNVIRYPSKFSRPGHPLKLPTKPERNTVHIPNTNPKSNYPASNPKSININDGKTTPMFRPGKIIVTPNNNDGQRKPSQSQFILNLSKYYQVKPQQIPFKPNQNPTLNNKGIQHSPLFLNNPNQPIVAAKQPQFGLKPDQGSVTPLINIGNQTDQQLIAFSPNFQINPLLINLSNQKKRISSIANEGSKEAPPYSMVPSSTAHHTNILNPPQIGVDSEHTQHKPSHSQFFPNPSVYYRNEYEAPIIIEVNPDQEQLIPHSKISYKHTKHYNPSHTSSEFGDDALIPKVRNKTRKYNTTHSHYEKHTTITYVSKYDPTYSANQIVHDPNQNQNEPQTYVYEHHLPDQQSQELDLTMSKVNYYLNLLNLQLDENEPQSKLTPSQTNNFPGRQQNYTLKVHPTVTEMNKYNGHDTPHQFDTYPHSPSDGKNTNQIKSYQNRITPTISMYSNIFANYPHSSSQPQFIPSQDYSKKGGALNYPKSAEGPQSLSYSTEDPTHPKSNKHLPSPFQTGHTQNQHPPRVFDDRGSINGFQYAHNAYEDPRQLKPVHKLLPSKLETPQNHQLPGFFDERGSADGFQYHSNSAENHTHPKVKLNKSPLFYPYTSIVNPEQPKDNLHISPHSRFGPAQNQHKPELFDNRGVKDEFQYAHNADKNSTHMKPVHKLLPIAHSYTPFGPTLIQHSPGILDERADGFQYPSNSAENPIHSRGNPHNPKVTQFGPKQNQHLPGMFHERGSADGFQYLSNSAEKPLHPKENIHKPPNSPFGSTTYKQLPGMFDERGSTDGFQYQSNWAEKRLHPKKNIHKTRNSPLGPITYKRLPGMYPYNFAGNLTHPKNLTHPEQNKQKQPLSQVDPNHNKPTPGMFDGRGSFYGFQYSFNSPENPLYPKDILHYPPHSQLGPPQNHHLPGVFHNRGSLGGFQYPSNSAENPKHLKHNKNIQPSSPFDPAQNQHGPGMFDERGSAGFHYPSNSAENPTHTKNNPNTILEPKFKQPQNQYKPSSSDDGYNHNNPLRPWMHLDHDQYKPSFFDNLPNGVHNIFWSYLSDHNKDSDTVTSAPKPRFTPDYDQYKPSSFDNLFNGIHQIPWSVHNQDNNALGSDAKITTSRFGFKLKQDQYGPSMVIDPSISDQNENIDLTDVDDNQLQIEQDVLTPSADLTDSVSTQYNVLLKLKPDGDPDSLLPTDDGKIPDDQLYPLFKAVKKLSDPPIDDSVFSVGSMDQLDLPFLFPGIAKILNYEPSQKQDDISPDESQVVQKNPLSKLKSKLKQLPENYNGILNWLKSKLNKLVPTKDNATVTKNDIDMTKIFNLLSKLMLPSLKDTAVLQNIPFSSFDPEIIENIMNDFKEDTLTATPHADSTHNYENSFKSVPTMPEESRPQAPPLKYPGVHIILHQPNDEDAVDFPPFIQTDNEINLPVDMDSEQLSTSMFPKMFNPRFRHRPKDQKEECGDGTQWRSNCHSCSCYFGQAMCVRLPDCELRPLGEPMTCKPYSHFKMGCYTCECNGDGVAECDATDCNTQRSGKSTVSGSTVSSLPIFHEFYDSKNTNEILQYYNFFKKLPKDCPKQNLQTQYPTCERGTSWVSSCHKCECNQSGKHECIKIDDCRLDIDKYGKPGRCKPNSKFYPKTNSMPCVECSCNDEGISYCPASDYKKH